MPHDALLTYLSELGEGDWESLRDAWNWLLGDDRDPADKAWIAAHDLSALGHIEIAWGEKIVWCAAPPVLTMIPRSGGRALLTGGRTRELYEPNRKYGDGGSGKLWDAANELDLWIDEWTASDGPTTAMVACESSADAERLAAELGISYTYSVADQLSRMLPSLAAFERLWQPGELPRGFEIERFDTAALRWVRTDDSGAFGLYRCRTWQRHVHALNAPTGWFRVSREPGVYEVLRWKRQLAITYDSVSFELRVPVAARLPSLHARAATLCSGRLPRFVRGNGKPHMLAYLNVDADIAARIQSTLAQGGMQAGD